MQLQSTPLALYDQLDERARDILCQIIAVKGELHQLEQELEKELNKKKS